MSNLRPTLSNILDEVRIEVIEQVEKKGPFRSPHEGYAVALEELDELWEHVRANTAYSPEAYKEAIQLAACGVIFCQMLAKEWMVAA